jgi:hypothetical protein
MKLTQNHTDGNHAKHSNGNPKDYPFDECCGDTGRGWFYCPCDKMKVVKKYTAGINTIWLESVSPVVMPIGTAYVTIMVEHMNDDDMQKLSVGQVFNRGEKMFLEGKDGATGNHFHISVGTGHKNGGGWSKNSKGAWVLTVTGRPLTADDAFYLGDTEVINAKGYSFKNKPKEGKNMEKLDNTPDKYAEKIIERARKQGVLVGDENGNEKLHSEITRQDALVFIYRAIDANK